MTDPISDMLTRIRNAALIGKPEVLVPMSKIKHEIAKLLKKEGLILDEEIVKTKSRKNKASQFDEIKLVLKYKKSGRSAITSLKRISKPGLKVYAKKTELPRVLNNLGIAIISTPEGLMTNKEARKKGLGGEVLCEIY
ncbi:30S ribosomal protein S8 [Candidatus Falkowbacteria bacterium RIFOXYB2_FULL_47_14]|uniref:Small ribosomal subunit protein uS8 n=1 Tax=Candidatus Falkowbacteria bacterium RIFOXYA2_FULL_47_19 TaxID=1797994 RepID=A0A1F5SIP5_9BACT|nr:MAG: 30S ribosomal protein S8 [Candidatus Falkowbacteria bacterium RIFOXYA2_FULL_47_19]OGF35449.1 MAG: 30S ribosomal protein S8 [Candidatus Falkowbacteria bacterium RIFOXYC2_FULL_46_15]OGF42559.1 MAG: 30S ribosomal protein S8 [Candidatus Falkowbacteria bacterium RIFOXYB2_FULL_47_14]